MKEIRTKEAKNFKPKIYDMDKLTVEKLNNLQRDGLIIDQIDTDKGIIKGHYEKASKQELSNE